MKKQLLIMQPVNNKVREHEFQAICEKTSLDPSQALGWDLFDPLLRDTWEKNKESIAAVIIAGAPYYIHDEEIEGEMKIIEKVVAEAMELHIPILGICFGHQAVAHVLGGKVEKDLAKKQKGFARVYRTEAAGDDPLFSELPSSFVSRINHEDHVVELPEGAIHLCYNSVSEFQAFRYGTLPVWGVQFHPETSEADVAHRYTHFGDTYFVSDEEQKNALNHVMPCDDVVHDILSAFWNYAKESLEQ